jgi:hypothetical protein
LWFDHKFFCYDPSSIIILLFKGRGFGCVYDELKMQAIGRPPRCFAREFGDQIDSRLMLRDPNHNEFEIHVTKKSKELYFDDGWFALRDVYDLWFGGWVTFAYVNPKLLTIRLTTRCGTEVEYPTHHPPLKHMLPRIELPLQAPSSTHSVSHNCFVRSFTKELTFYDMYSGTLVFISLSLFTFFTLMTLFMLFYNFLYYFSLLFQILPWFGFGEHVFEFAYSELILIDNVGDHFPCKLKFGVDPEGHLACKISGGWVDYCTLHGVCHHDKLKFSIVEPAHNYELYVSFDDPSRKHGCLG